MSDPVVVLTNGVPTSGTGTITTLGAVVTALGTPMQASGGSVTANAGTNLNTSALALETGGNLAATAAVLGTTSGAAVTTSATGTLQQYLRGIVSLLVSGITVAAHAVTNAGTFAVQNTAATPAGTNVIGHVIVDTAPSTAVTNTGTFAVQAAATLAAETTKAIGVTRTADGSGNLLTSTSNALDVNIKSGGGSGGTAIADEAAFTEGTTSLTPIGGVFKTSHTALTTGQAGAVALSAAREMMTLGKVWDGTNTVTVKAASTAPAATDPALVVAISPNSVNSNGLKTPANSAPVVAADGYAQYETVAASQTAQVLGATGATGDYLAGVLVFPGTAGCGVVTIFDNATTIGTFAGGGTTALPSLVPFLIPVGLFSVSGAWKITTGANVTCVGIGNFT